MTKKLEILSPNRVSAQTQPSFYNKRFPAGGEDNVFLTDALFPFPSEKRKLETARGPKQQKKFKKTKDTKQKWKKHL